MITRKKIIKYLIIYFVIQIPLLIIGKRIIIKNGTKIDKEINIKEMNYKLYNYEYGYEVGLINIAKTEDGYIISLMGKEYSDTEKNTEYPYNFEKIELNNVKLKNEEILETNILLGEFENYKILVSKEWESKSIFADEIYNECWDYYFLLVLTQNDFEKIITQARHPHSDISFEIRRNKNCVYKACFFNDFND